MALIDNLKIRLNVTTTDKTNLLTELIADVEGEIKEYCNISVLETKHDSLIKDIVVFKWNRLSSEGLSSESFSGVNQSYTDDYTKDIKRKLRRFRRLPNGY